MNYGQLTEYSKQLISGDDAVQLSQLGYFCFQGGLYDLACECFLKSYQLNKNDYFVVLYLIDCLKKRDQNLEALEIGVGFLEADKSDDVTIIQALLPILNVRDKKGVRELNINQKSVKKLEGIIENIQNDCNNLLAQFYFQLGNDEFVKSSKSSDIIFGEVVGVKKLVEFGLATYRRCGNAGTIIYHEINGKNSDITVNQPEPYVAEIPNAILSSSSSLIRVKNFIVSDYLSHPEFGKFCMIDADPTLVADRGGSILVKSQPNREFVEKGIFLSGTASSAYGHWTQEFLPKLRFFETHPDFKEFKIIIDADMPSTHYDYLKSLVSNDLFILPKSAEVLVGRLLVAPADSFFPTDLKYGHTVPVEYQSTFTKDAIVYLRQKIITKRNYKSPSKTALYINRRSSSWRCCENSRVVGEYLKKYNFKEVDLTEYSFDDQVKLFSDAGIVVAENGSALNNIIFCHSETPIIILGSKYKANLGVWYGSFRSLGYTLAYVEGEPLNGSPSKHSNYVIDIQKLDLILKKYLPNLPQT